MTEIATIDEFIGTITDRNDINLLSDSLNIFVDSSMLYVAYAINA